MNMPMLSRCQVAKRRPRLFKIFGAIVLVTGPWTLAVCAPKESCSSDVARLFSAYLVDVNNGSGHAAQYYSQEFLAWQADSLLKNNGDAASAITLFRNRLTTGRGSELVNSHIACKGTACTLRAYMKNAAGRSYSFVLKYVSANGSCSDLRIDGIEFIEKLEIKPGAKNTLEIH